MIRTFLVRHTRHFFQLALVLTIGLFTLAMSGCGVPTWLSDAQNIVALVGTSITAIGSFLAGLTGNAALAAGLAVLSTWITKVEQGVSDIETLVTQYNASPTPTLLSDIEAALIDVETNIQQDFSNLGLPTSILSVVTGIAALALSQLEAWGSLLPAIKAGAMATFIVKTPYTKAEYKELINKILSTPTGDAEVDVALAKAKRL
jgi:hypothetical protein